MKSIYRHATRMFASSLAALILLTGCATTNTATNTAEQPGPAASPAAITLLTPKAPSLIPAVYMEKTEADGTFQIAKWDSIEQLLAGIQGNEAPLYAAPINVGANLYAKGMPIQLLHVNTYGSMYLISLDPNVRELSQLSNETVYIPGQSGPPDILTQHLLAKKGLQGKVNLAYGVIPDIMQQLAAGTIKHAVLPEPVLSGLRMKTKGKVSEVVDFQKEWQAEFGQDLPQTAVFVNRDWAKTHAADIARFEQSYQEAVRQVNQQAGETLKIAAEEFGMPEAVLASALPKITLLYKDAQTAKPEVERYLGVLLQIAPDSIGGSVPDADFYYGS